MTPNQCKIPNHEHVFSQLRIEKTHKMMEIKMVEVISNRIMYFLFIYLYSFENTNTTRLVCFLSQHLDLILIDKYSIL